MPPNSRRQLWTIASNTGCVSVGELLITFRISEVAICRSSASFVSLNKRTFSIAITAWLAKVITSSSWTKGIGPGSFQRTTMAPIGLPSRSIGTPNNRRQPTLIAKRWS